MLPGRKIIRWNPPCHSSHRILVSPWIFLVCSWLLLVPSSTALVFRPATKPVRVLNYRSGKNGGCLVRNRMIARFSELESHRIRWSSEVEGDFRPPHAPQEDDSPQEKAPTTSDRAPLLREIRVWLSESLSVMGKPPPIQVDDLNVLFYDIFLLINLTVSYVARSSPIP